MEKKEMVDKELRPGMTRPPFFLFLFALMLGWVVPVYCGQLSDFLHDSKKKAEIGWGDPKNKKPTIHIVLGNESADLDSIASSIAYAYLLNSKNGSSSDTITIPLLNLNRGDLALRKDTLYVFNLLQISANDLLFLDDPIPLNNLMNENRLRITLVDHNRLRPDQEPLSRAVKEIIDHHFDEKVHYPLLNPENKMITLVGSTATLITEKVLKDKPTALTSELATLLLGAILIDNSNLQSAEKTTEQDRRAFESLRAAAPGLDTQDLYEKLVEARSNVTGLSPDQLLNKDFKSYSDGDILYGIAGLPKSVHWWIEDEKKLLPIWEAFSREKGIALLIIMMTNPDKEGPKRKLIVYSPSKELLDAIDTSFQTDPRIYQIQFPGPHDERVRYYTAEEILARKKLQPLINLKEISH